MIERFDITNTMMEMCMWTCSMSMTCCVYPFDVLSISRVSPCAA